VCLLARTAEAQTPTSPAAATSQPVRVFLTCDGCDAALKAAATFVEYVADRQLATLEVVIEAKPPEGETRTWQFTYTGRSAFTGQDRRLSLSLPAAASADEIRAGLVRVFKFGLVEYALRSDSGQHLDVSFAAPETAGQAAAPGTPVHDPWNYWVFRVGTSTDGYGEVSQASRYYSGSVSANRTTEEWKIRLSGYKSGSTSRYEVSDEETVRTNERQWNLDSLVVKSLGEHWSAGFTSTLNSSTYSNQRLTANFSPAVEYDVFPYSESSQRSLTIQYTAGVWHYRYGELTIYDKLRETIPQHSVTASLGLRQPWGTAGAAAVFSQALNAPEFNRQSVDGSVNVRIFKGFTVNASVSFSRIRDQFYLEKRGASDEEVLLRLRQLATGHRYSINFGLSYSFGSLSNATVNPRFGS
jgi:hypothetical protein